MELHDSSKIGSNAYPLPPGWHDGQEVTVIGFDYGYVRVLGDGKETTVFIVNIDSGWDEQYAPWKWRERRPPVDSLLRVPFIIDANGTYRYGCATR